MQRAGKIVLGVIAVVLVLVVIALIVLPRTDFGRARVREAVVSALRDRVNGLVHVGRIEGNLLGTFTIHDIVISDSAGNPFLVLDRARANIELADLQSKRITISELTLVDPLVVLSQAPDGDWNFQQIFDTGPDTTADTTRGFGDWITLTDVSVQRGRLVVRQRWSPDSGLSPRARDSVTAAVLDGAGRARVERRNGHLVQVMDFRSIDAKIPWMFVANPDSNAMLMRVAHLDMIAEPFRPPAATITELRAVVRIGSDTVLVRDATLRLPDSRLTGRIAYLTGPGTTTLDLQGDSVALADLRWLYPRLPGEGTATLALDATIAGEGPSEYIVRNATVHQRDARIAGDFGLVLGDTITRFVNTSLELSRVPTTLAEQLVPGLDVPVPGVVRDGHVRVEGPLDAMQVNLSATFDPRDALPTHLTARGGVGFGETPSARDLRVTVDSFPVALVRTFASGFPLRGTASGRATVSGSWDDRLTGEFSVAYAEGGRVSRVLGNGSLAPGTTGRVNVTMRLVPLSLATVGRFAPSVDLTGNVAGTVHVRGTTRALALRANLALPEGHLIADGSLDLTGREPAYSATLELRRVNLAAAAPALPAVRLSGVSAITGRGLDPATMNGRLAARFRDVVFDSTSFTDLRAAVALADGLLTVDTLRLDTRFATAFASGTFGITPQREGVLAYDVRVDSLASLRRWIAVGDTTVMEPRPGGGVALGIRRDSLAGAIHTSGELRGNIARFSARGRAEAGAVVWDGSSLRHGRVEYAVIDARAPAPSIIAAAALDSLRAAGFALDSVRTHVRYANPSGDIDIAIFPGDTAQYAAGAEFTLRPGEGSVRLRDLRLVLDSTTWVSAHPSRIAWGGPGIAIDSLDLRPRHREGRIFVNGRIPAEGTGDLTLSLDRVQIGDWLTLLQSGVQATGTMVFRASVDGTLAHPVVRGAFGLANATYRDTPFPTLRAGFDYADRRLAVDAMMVRGDVRLATIDASVPVDLALADAGPRLPDAPLRIDVEGDSIPLAPLGDVTDAVSNVQGTAAGRIAVRGTTAHPTVAGGLLATLSTLGVDALGVTLTDVTGLLRMVGDSLIVDSLRARSEGLIQATGAVDLARLSEPGLNIDVTASDATVLDNELGELSADARLHIAGPLRDLSITGNASILRGVVYAPDPAAQRVLSLDNPAVLAVIDSARAARMELPVTQPNPLRNLRVDVDLSVSRGTWVRSADANVEVFGDLDIGVDQEADQTTLRGTLYTERGEYTFAGRRFLVTSGAVQFIGDPEINPLVQVRGHYEVQLAGRPPLDVRVLVGGTMREPDLALESDAQPPLSQSDLIAYLAFGRSTGSLLQTPGSALESGGASGSRLVGNVAALATRQLAAFALGALVEDVEQDVVSRSGLDVLNISPAQLPAELSISGAGALLRGTEVELGKYFTRRTFVAANVRPTFTLPGLRFDRRLTAQTGLRALFESRFVPQQPSLTTGTRPETIHVLGGAITWSLSW